MLGRYCPRSVQKPNPLRIGHNRAWVFSVRSCWSTKERQRSSCLVSLATFDATLNRIHVVSQRKFYLNTRAGCNEGMPTLAVASRQDSHSENSTFPNFRCYTLGQSVDPLYRNFGHWHPDWPNEAIIRIKKRTSTELTVTIRKLLRSCRGYSLNRNKEGMTICVRSDRIRNE